MNFSLYPHSSLGYGLMFSVFLILGCPLNNLCLLSLLHYPPCTPNPVKSSSCLHLTTQTVFLKVSIDFSVTKSFEHFSILVLLSICFFNMSLNSIPFSFRIPHCFGTYYFSDHSFSVSFPVSSSHSNSLLFSSWHIALFTLYTIPEWSHILWWFQLSGGSQPSLYNLLCQPGWLSST